MQTLKHYKIPLADLLKVLLEDGYELTIEQILEIQSVLLSSSVTDAPLNDLKYVITPIIAKSNGDQQALYKIIDNYIAEKTYQPPGLPGWFARINLKKRLLMRMKVAAILAVIAAGISIYFYNASTDNKARPVSAIKKDNIVNATSPTTEQPGNTTPATAPINQGLPIVISVTASHGPIPPKTINNNLQMSLVFGAILGAVLFYLLYYQSRGMSELAKRKRPGTTNTDDQKRPASDNWNAYDEAGRFEHVSLQFPEKEFLIQEDRDFSAIRINFKKPAPVEHVGLDVEQSIYRTSQHAGFTSLVYDSAWKVRKYIVLQDNTYEGGHLTALLNYFIEFLTNSQIPLIKYTFTNDISVVKDVSHKTKKLDDLSHLLDDHHLIIIGDGHSFFNEHNLQVKKNLAAIFERWRYKSIITPVPLPDWTRKESQLQNNGFNIVPAEIEAIKLVSNAIAESSVIKKDTLKNQVRHTYSVSSHDFKSIQGLKDYLGNEVLFQFVCSLAIHPRIDWSVTLALSSSILKAHPSIGHTIKLDYNTLLKIARIPWLHTNDIPEQMRAQLLYSIDRKTEIIARETLIHLLEEVKPGLQTGTPAFRELRLQQQMHGFFLYNHDPVRYRRYADERKTIMHYLNDLMDEPLKNYIHRHSSNLMPLNSEGKHMAIEEFVLQEKLLEKHSINWSKFAVLALPAILLYILFSIFRPTVVYPEIYKSGAFASIIINKNDKCVQNLQGVVASFKGNLTTFPLDSLKTTDTILLQDIRYNERIDLNFSRADGGKATVSFNARDTFYTLSVKCY